ncbi:MAG: hypothetical protein RH942_17260 [Kiloniellaceae bacterium]
MRDLHPHLKSGKDYIEPLVRETAVENITLVVIPAIARFVLRSWHRIARWLKGAPKT